MDAPAAKKVFVAPWGPPLKRRRDEAFASQAVAAREAVARAPDSGRETIAFKVERTDFQAAAARNARNTNLLLAALAGLAVVVGYAAGWGAEILTDSHPVLADPRHRPEMPGLILATLVSSWGLTAAMVMGFGFAAALLYARRWADSTVLKLNGAVEADPGKDAVLHNVVEEIAIAGGLPKPAVHVVESDALNAFATGFHSDRAAVAVTRGLLNRLNREELQGVVAHEMAHVGNGDVRLAVAVAMIVGLISILSDLLRNTIRPGVGSSSRSRKGGGGLVAIVMVVWILVIVLAPICALLVRMTISREREYLADATAARLTRNPVGLASALAKIAENPRIEKAPAALEHVWIESPARAYDDRSSALFSTHPPTAARIKRLLDLR